MKTCALTLAAAALCACSVCAQESRNPAEEHHNPLGMKKEVIEAGQKRFKSGCAMCHGAYAEGGRGPALANNWDVRQMSDDQLFRTIEHGIPETSMPPSNLPEQNAWEVAAYVRSLSSPASQSAVNGNPEQGRQLFFGAGQCSSCHAIRGQGGRIAPDLTDAGSMTLGELRESIITPSKQITPGFAHVTVELKSGEVIDGVAKADTDYTITVLDHDAHLRRLSKSTCATVTYFHNSLMPENISDRLGPRGVEDVLAFLAQQVSRRGNGPVQDRQHAQ